MIVLLFMTDEYPEFYRAGGDIICDDCGKKYYDHPMSEDYLDYDGYKWLWVICSGELVKL
ncbi:hypothetical protein LCGC14_0381480 [marine sediment metagenome]|uniref:Uncharacterized protein n=1 Tax=marine sediment metagenome TaxID=412755 RepID=A0A0F9VPB7_9ZZZZ